MPSSFGRSRKQQLLRPMWERKLTSLITTKINQDASTLLTLLLPLAAPTLSHPFNQPQTFETFDSYAITNYTSHISIACYEKHPDYAPWIPLGKIPMIEGHTLQADSHSSSAFKGSGVRVSIENGPWAPHDGKLPPPRNGMEIFQEKDEDKEKSYGRYYCIRF
ncbi:uncharacterized protein BDZ99DRAFT_520023 [Mytilinidion resinicola]|uniref:Uncharacterized protein n=1 Tax=Mytilinidion resinicola TaxID=574789 RepID=A0A6A6YN09_9PEZI|nr:uncharacterized protein BDZ99DRAFT_520023 [Mytilinidion resinicola]KAF2809928.1 hypothetical protein BDZ99DRAFT_520023 [Mytilinidion resinicola]